MATETGPGYKDTSNMGKRELRAYHKEICDYYLENRWRKTLSHFSLSPAQASEITASVREQESKDAEKAKAEKAKARAEKKAAKAKAPRKTRKKKATAPKKAPKKAKATAKKKATKASAPTRKTTSRKTAPSGISKTVASIVDPKVLLAALIEIKASSDQHHLDGVIQQLLVENRKDLFE